MSVKSGKFIGQKVWEPRRSDRLFILLSVALCLRKPVLIQSHSNQHFSQHVGGTEYFQLSGSHNYLKCSCARMPNILRGQNKSSDKNSAVNRVKARAFLFAYTLYSPCGEGCAQCLFEQDSGEDMWPAILDTCNLKVNTSRIPATNQLQLCFNLSQNSVEQQFVCLESLKGL